MPNSTLERLVDDHHVALFRFTHQLTACPKHAARLTTHAFAAWLRQPSAYGPPRCPRLGLLAAAYRESLRSRLSGLDSGSWRDEASEGTLTRLDLAHRACLALFYLENLGGSEIADLLGLPAAEVLARLHEGKARLRELVFVPV